MTLAARVRATYELVRWPEDAEVPDTQGGWCDPLNPGGTMGVWDPDYDPRVVGEPVTHSLTLWEAAYLVVRFPGAVWDYRDSEATVFDFGTGTASVVTLHVMDHLETVLTLADLADRWRTSTFLWMCAEA